MWASLSHAYYILLWLLLLLFKLSVLRSPEIEQTLNHWCDSHIHRSAVRHRFHGDVLFHCCNWLLRSDIESSSVIVLDWRVSIYDSLVSLSRKLLLKLLVDILAGYSNHYETKCTTEYVMLLHSINNRTGKWIILYMMNCASLIVLYF